MSTATASLIAPSLGRFVLTNHAHERLTRRSIPRAAVEAALEFGRCVAIRGAQIFALGRREIERSRLDGIDLATFEGTQVVVTDGGVILTAYRNKDFRGLRPRGRSKGRR